MRDWTAKYILNGREIVKVDSVEEWAECFNDMNRQIGLDHSEDGTITISTVFLGLDHGFNFDDSPPILFETMIFGGEHDGFMERYATYDEAEAGHDKICECELGRSSILNLEFLDA